MPKIPKPHQTKGAEYLINRGSGFLWMGMRCGKSLTTMLGSTNDFPILILGPLTTLAGWVDEILDFGFSRSDFVIVRGNYNQKLNLLRSERFKFYLINYDVAKQLDVAGCRRRTIPHGSQHVLDMSQPRFPFPLRQWKAIILDESYYLANGGSNRTDYWLSVPSQERRIALSGLPAPESLRNFASQYFIVDGHFMGYTDYNKYMVDNWMQNPWDHKWEPVHPYHAIRVMEYVQANSYIVSMEEVQKDYAGEMYSIWEVEPTKEQIYLYEWLEQAVTYRWPHETLKDEAHPMLAAVRFSFAMQVSAGVHPLTKEKIPCRKSEYIIEWYKIHKEPAVVMSASKRGLLYLAEELINAGITCRVVHGDTSIGDRGKFREQFQKGDFDLFLVQTTTVKMGYDLSRTNTIFHFSNTHSCDTRSQADKRGGHLTKTTPVQIVDLCIEGTRERGLVKTLITKHEDARVFIGKPIKFYQKD